MKRKRNFNHIWWIVPVLIVLFFVVFIIFRSIKNNCLTTGDWLAFTGAYLGFAGSVILGYVAIYQNRKLRDDNERKHKNSIKPILNFNYKKIHLLNLVDMREYFHHVIISDNDKITYTNFIPRDIRALHKEYRDLDFKSTDKAVSNKEYQKLENNYFNNVSKLAKKYLLLDLYLDNNGNGNAINIELHLNNQKISISPSLQSNKYNASLLLVEISSKQNTTNLKLDLFYEDIDNENFTNKEEIEISRDVNGQLTINEK